MLIHFAYLYVHYIHTYAVDIWCAHCKQSKVNSKCYSRRRARPLSVPSGTFICLNCLYVVDAAAVAAAFDCIESANHEDALSYCLVLGFFINVQKVRTWYFHFQFGWNCFNRSLLLNTLNWTMEWKRNHERKKQIPNRYVTTDALLHMIFKPNLTRWSTLDIAPKQMNTNTKC